MNTFSTTEQYLAGAIRKFAKNANYYAEPGDELPAILAVLTVAVQDEAKAQGINLVITYVGGSDAVE